MTALGQPVRLSFRTYSDAAETTLADPTTVSLEVLEPDGTETTYTWAAAQVIRDSLGVFHYDYTPDQAGHYAYHWTATGTVATALDGSFDVTAKYDPQLISIDDVRAHVPDISLDDDQVQQFIDTATDIVEDLAGPVVRQTVTEWHDGGHDLIILNSTPVLGVTSVTEYNGSTSQVIADEPEDGGAFTDYGFRVNTDAGLIYRTAGGYSSAWSGRVKIVYVAGRTDVPANMRMAALEAVRLLYSKSQGMGAAEYPVSLSDFDITFITNLLGSSRRAPSVA